MATEIAAASPADLPVILAIYNDVIRHSTAVYSEVELARDESGILGFGTFGDFRAWPCYRFGVEHGVHVRSDRCGQGIGRMLLVELIARAAALGNHVMIAGIDADNKVSIGLHESLGFTLKVGDQNERFGFVVGAATELRTHSSVGNSVRDGRLIPFI